MREEPDWLEVKDLFADALDLPPDEREAFLAERCAGRPELRAEVDSLLAESPDEGTSFLEVPAISMFETAAPEVGAQIGGYRLRSIIGEGGMGRVFEATQEHPHRTVALKVLRPGFFSPDAERRFHYEVEALGKLSHEGIARVFDAGAERTADGHEISWFAMERIQGTPFLEAADHLHLNRAERLRLFLRTADAVAHAHQRGILHRDLKPDNILVDKDVAPRVLDFGIARALDPHASTVTSTGEIVGTIAYMSPEQVLGDPSAVDARSDVYALGVLLYRLLTGAAPIELSGMPLPQAARMLAEGRPTPAGQRDRSLRGDLETILSKALEHDVQRRYATVDAFASDVRAMLDNRTISARPPTAIYQVKQFARRNRGLVTGLSLAVLALVAGLVGTSVGFVRAARARDAAEVDRDRTQQANAFLERLLASADPESGSYEVRVVDLLRQASIELNDEPEGDDRGESLDAAVRASMRTTIGDTFLRLGLEAEARPHLEKALAWFEAHDGPESVGALGATSSLAEAALLREDAEEAKALIARLETSRDMQGDSAPDWLLVNPTELRAKVAEAEGDMGEHLRLAREAFEAWCELRGEGSDSTEVARSNLASALVAAGHADEADRLLESGIERLRKEAGEYHPRLLTQELLRAQIAVQVFEYASGLEQLEALRERGLIVWGPNHADTMALLGSIGDALLGLGRTDQAIAIQRDVLDRSEQAFGPSHQTTVTRRGNLATTLMYAGDFASAEALLRTNLSFLQGAKGVENPFLVLQQEMALASAVENQENYEAALPLSESVIRRLREFVDDSHPQLLIARNNLAMLYVKLEQPEKGLEIARNVLALAEEHQPGHRMNMYPLRSNLGRALAAAGQFEEAEQEYLTVESALSQDDEATEVETARIAELLALNYEAWGKPDEAARRK